MKVYIDMDATLVDFAAQVTKLGLWRKNKAEDKAAYADGGSILVDDNKETTDLFEANGGHSILFTGDWSEVLRKVMTTFF